MSYVAKIAAAVWFALAGAASAGDAVVVELFTSQGCSSCPPADTILGKLAQQDDVIALAMHVDYWDYLGWRDDFASPEFTKRQRAYARAKGERTIYTPQMVINGDDHVIGSRSKQVGQIIKAHAAKTRPVQVELKREGNQILIVAKATKSIPGAVVQLVTFQPKATVKVRRGENAGRTLDYHNVVRQLIKVGNWDGRSEYRASANVPDGTPVAVLVQGTGAGPILGASQLR